MSTIEATIARALEERADALEAACERMLTDPRGWGVLEHDYGLRWTVELSPDVPLYEVHTHKAVEGRPCAGCENRH
jgi:hypothetical protein